MIAEAAALAILLIDPPLAADAATAPAAAAAASCFAPAAVAAEAAAAAAVSGLVLAAAAATSEPGIAPYTNVDGGNKYEDNTAPVTSIVINNTKSSLREVVSEINEFITDSSDIFILSKIFCTCNFSSY
jgi:hypothetical protein